MKTKISLLPVLQIVVLGSCLAFTLITSAQEATTTDTPTETVTTVDDSAVLPTEVAQDQMSVSAETTSEETTSSVANSDAAANAATEAEASTAQHSQYGLQDVWKQGDVVARGTLIIMILMSAATWYVLVTKLIQQQILLSQAKQTNRFWDAKDINDSVKTYKELSAFRSVAEEGIVAAKHHAAKTGEKLNLSDWLASQLQRAVDRVGGQLQNGLSILATVGSTSPFVGLFGTVWGIYHALIAIGLAGQASIDKVAGPVGEALIMTAIGLFVAVPAVLGYNWLVRRNKVIVDSLRDFAADMHANLTMGVRGGHSN